MEINNVIKIAKERVLHYNNLNQTIIPHMIIPKNNKIKEILELEFNERTKAKALADLKKMVEKENINQYFIFYEGAVTKIKQEGKLFWKTETKEKVDMLFVDEYRNDFKNKNIVIPLKRENNKIIFEKEIDQTNWKQVSVWNFYDKEKAIKEALKKAIMDMDNKKNK